MGSKLTRAAEEQFERGNALDENGQRDAAIAAWQEAIHLDPDHAAAHYNLAIAFLDEGETVLAIEMLRASIRLDPFDVDARCTLADVYLETDRFEDAVNQLRQVLNMAPGHGDAAHLLAQAYLDHEMWDEASGALEAGLMQVEDANLWYRLGRAFSSLGRQEDAILSYRRALVCLPEHKEAIHALDLLHVPIEEPQEPNFDE